eukprot:13859097-Alexandrium_andersonii.AAC.1
MCIRDRPNIPHVPGLRGLYFLGTGRHRQLRRESCTSDAIPEKRARPTQGSCHPKARAQLPP